MEVVVKDAAEEAGSEAAEARVSRGRVQSEIGPTRQYLSRGRLAPVCVLEQLQEVLLQPLLEPIDERTGRRVLADLGNQAEVLKLANGCQQRIVLLQQLPSEFCHPYPINLGACGERNARC